MARIAKIDNAFKKRFERVEKKRSTDNRIRKVYYLIICEGERTEPNYFEAFSNELPRETVDLKIEGTGRNTIGLVEYAIKQRENSLRKYDRVWVVFDKDDFPDDNFNGAIIKAKDNNLNCAWTNEAFELWFLLHFQFIDTGMKREAYKSYLEREVIRVSGNKSYRYLKNDKKTYLILKSHGNQSQAILRAKQLIQNYSDGRHATHNPCTRIHELIEELLNPQEVLRKLEEE